tara:strand:+ start:359 stop:601 length:243 start_codon:yes stop_codon:yes gene_type:complete
VSIFTLTGILSGVVGLVLLVFVGYQISRKSEEMGKNEAESSLFQRGDDAQEAQNEEMVRQRGNLVKRAEHWLQSISNKGA